jgi:rhodanese-related sulfurtransferase
MIFKDQNNINHILGTSVIQDRSINRESIIDIREPFEFDVCSIPGSLHIPMYTLASNLDKFLDKDKTYYILCHHGVRSYQMTAYLQDLGYSVINIQHGIHLINEVYIPY